MQDEKIIVDTDNPSLLRTLDAAEAAGIKAAESRTARKIFLKIADRLKLSPADERREAKGGSPQKFWTPAQIDSPVIDVDADFCNTKQFFSEEDSATVIAPAADVQIDSASVNDIEPAQDSEPANGIDRVGSDNLRDVFKLILEVNDADKLRRIRDFADARIAALDEQKNNADRSRRVIEKL